MAEFKLVIANPKTGKCVQKEVKDEAANGFLGKKIGDVIRGELIDMTGYEFKLTGGSDYCGFPMRADIEGPVRKKILLVSGAGAKPVKKKIRKNKPFQFYPGTRQRKTVCGNTVFDKITQLNLLVVKHGSTPLGDEPAPEAAAEAAPEAAAPAEAPKEAAPAEEKKEEAPQAPAEEKKEAAEPAKEEAAPEAKAEEVAEEKKEEPATQEAPAEAPAEEKKEE